MKHLIKKLKLVSVGVMALSFLMAVTLSSCGGSTSDYSDDAEATEAVEESAESTEEHPAGEHPAGDSEEHPSDSTATEGEQPSDSTATEG